MSVGQSNIMVSYERDTGSDGNIMPLNMYKKLFPSITNEQLVATKNKNGLLKIYNKTTIKLGMCIVTVEHNNNKKQEKACGLKAQPLEYVVLGSNPSVNRKLLTHILTNTPIHPCSDIWDGHLQ